MRWQHRIDDGDEEFELIDGNRLYLLRPAGGERVNAEGRMHDGVEWFVDFARVVNGEVESRRYVTVEALDPEAAKSWALEVAA